jgi:hypothetical protein
MTTRAIGILRWAAAAALAVGFVYFLGMAGGHMEMDTDAQSDPFLLSYQGRKEAGLAVASALCFIAATLLIRRNPRYSGLAMLFLALAALCVAEPFVARYLGAEYCHSIGGHWSDRYCSCKSEAPSVLSSNVKPARRYSRSDPTPPASRSAAQGQPRPDSRADVPPRMSPESTECWVIS